MYLSGDGVCILACHSVPPLGSSTVAGEKSLVTNLIIDMCSLSSSSFHY